MAIVKHIKSRNANYSDALDYLIFQHDESTGKMILDEFNRPLRRDELYMDGLNCNPDTMNVMNILKRTEANPKSKVITISSVMILPMLLNVI